MWKWIMNKWYYIWGTPKRSCLFGDECCTPIYDTENVDKVKKKIKKSTKIKKTTKKK